MRYVSVFSGIEAASVAWGPLGWQPVCFCEVDEFPKAVLRHRFPSVPNLGDITKIDWRSLAKCAGWPDAVVGGSPCQSVSVAGARTGLEGESGLMWEYVRAVSELMPRWILWENVPGALSSSHGEDFRCLLRSLDELGYGLAWRVLDAQFFGVAQRRERVFVVGYLGDPAPPSEVLFESESLRWDTPTSREKRKELAAGAGGGAASAGGGAGGGADALDVCVQGNIARGARMGQNGAGVTSDGSAYTLGTLDIPAVVASNCTPIYEIQGNAIGRAEKNGPGGRGWCDPDDNGAYSLTACDRHAVIAPTAKTLQVRCGKEGGGKGALVQDDLSATLSTSNVQTLFQPVGFAQNTRDEVRLQGGDGSVSGALSANPGMKQTTYVAQGYTVRRLTPRECERLQGFPDDWTKIPYRGKPADECPDTPRYKAIGNSMAVNVMRWLGVRIDAAERGAV